MKFYSMEKLWKAIKESDVGTKFNIESGEGTIQKFSYIAYPMDENKKDILFAYVLIDNKLEKVFILEDMLENDYRSLDQWIDYAMKAPLDFTWTASQFLRKQNDLLGNKYDDEIKHLEAELLRKINFTKENND